LTRCGFLNLKKGQICFILNLTNKVNLSNILKMAWRRSDRMKVKKFLKWSLVILVVLIAIGILVENSEEEFSIEEDKILEYEIADIGTAHLGEVKRYTYHVVINEEGGIEELQETSKKVVEQAKEEIEFNALDIGFYDYEEYVNTGYVLGKSRYVPHGDWDKAMEVETGEYENFQFVWDLREKKWAAQLTQEEVEIWKEFDDLLWEEPEIDEDTIKELVSENFNITVEEVEDILSKERTWRWMDLSD